MSEMALRKIAITEVPIASGGWFRLEKAGRYRNERQIHHTKE